MSLHAPLSPDTQKRLAAQRRTSTLTSLAIALLVMVLVGVILMIIALASQPTVVPDFKYVGLEPPEAEEPVIKKTAVLIRRQPASPAARPNSAIVAITDSPIFIPAPKVITSNPDINSFPGAGEGIGDEGFDHGRDTPGDLYRNIPDDLSKRCSPQNRLARLLGSGGSRDCEDAVVNSLRWLKETQNPDGSWTQDKPVGMTGLALLAFLGHCETAGSAEFGEAVLSALTYLIDLSLKNDGKLASDLQDNHWCYEHAIATYALAEAYTLCVKSFGENIPQLPRHPDAGIILPLSARQCHGLRSRPNLTPLGSAQRLSRAIPANGPVRRPRSWR